jgi:hypothetical protein
MVIKYGLTYNNIRYGWVKKELYRLPVKIGNRYYCLKKLKNIKIGNNFGYRLSQKPFTNAQLEELTVLIEPYFVNKINDISTPF